MSCPGSKDNDRDHLKRTEDCQTLRNFVRAAERLDDPLRFLDLKPEFGDLLNDGALTEIINRELIRLCVGSAYGPAIGTVSHLTIYRSKDVAIHLNRVDPSTRGIGLVRNGEIEGMGQDNSLQSRARHTLLGVAGINSVSFDFYAQDKDVDYSILDRTAALRYVGNSVLERGQTLSLEAGRDIIEVTAAQDSVLLAAVSAPTLDVVWNYDEKSLLPIRMISE